jgi:hypothetical protein
MLELLTLACGEYAIKKFSVLKGIGSSRKGEKMYKMAPRRGLPKNAKDRCKCEQSTNIHALKSKIMCETNSRRTVYVFGSSQNKKNTLKEQRFATFLTSNATWKTIFKTFSGSGTIVSRSA